MNQLTKQEKGLEVGMWFVAWMLLLLTGTVMLVNVYTGYVGIMASGFVDFANDYKDVFAVVIALTFVVFNLIVNHTVMVLWRESGEVKFWQAYKKTPNMQYTSFVLAMSYGADTATQVWALANGNYDSWNIVYSFLVSIAVFTLISELGFSIAMGYIVGNYEYVKPLFKQSVVTQTANTTAPPQFQSGNRQTQSTNNQNQNTRG